MEKEINLDKLSLEELKIMAYDNLRQLEIFQRNQELLNRTIIEKEKNIIIEKKEEKK